MCVQVFALNSPLTISARQWSGRIRPEYLASIWRPKMLDLAPHPSRIAGSLLTLDRGPDFAPGRFSVWLITEHQQNLPTRGVGSMLICRNNGTLLGKRPELHAGSLSRRSFLGAGAAALFMARIGGGVAQAAIGRNIYVSNTGSDSNPGTADKPFATINGVFRRITDLGAGDRIVVMPGTYYEAVNINAGGTAEGNLMLVSQVPYGAKIRSPASSYSAINIQKNFVTVDGFDVSGSGTGHGIEATFLDGDTSKNGPHHITIINNISHDNAGGGIELAYGDYYLIDNNICYGNCATNSYQGSGISVYEPRAVAGADESSHHRFAQHQLFQHRVEPDQRGRTF